MAKTNKNEEKDKIFLMRLPLDLNAKVEERAEGLNLTKTTLLRLILTRFFEIEEDK